MQSKSIMWHRLMKTAICTALFAIATNGLLNPATSEDKKFVVTSDQRGDEIPPTDEELTPTDEPLRVKRINGEIPYLDTNLDKLRNAFRQTEPITIELHTQDKKFPQGGGSISHVEVRSFHNGEWIYFNLTWQDETENTRRVAPQQFADTAALMFPLTRPEEISPEKPFSPRMGKKGQAVNILQWKADWEEDLGSYAGFVGVDEEYPRDMTKYYDPVVEEVKELNATPSRQGGGRAAGNLFSQPDRGRSVEELNAEGFGTLTSQDLQDSFGNASWQDGKWNIIIAKPLRTEDPNDTQFEPGTDTFINFAVWNGVEEDRNGQKSVSLRWHPIIIEK